MRLLYLPTCHASSSFLFPKPNSHLSQTALRPLSGHSIFDPLDILKAPLSYSLSSNRRPNISTSSRPPTQPNPLSPLLPLIGHAHTSVPRKTLSQTLPPAYGHLPVSRARQMQKAALCRYADSKSHVLLSLAGVLAMVGRRENTHISLRIWQLPPPLSPSPLPHLPIAPRISILVMAIAGRSSSSGCLTSEEESKLHD
jgi:hypothetical protein